MGNIVPPLAFVFPLFGCSSSTPEAGPYIDSLARDGDYKLIGLSGDHVDIGEGGRYIRG